MYNLTVDEAHTFFVGDGDWLVHNTRICRLAPYWGDEPRQKSGLSNLNQLAMTYAIRYTDPNLIIGARPIALGAAYLDGVVMSKPELAKKLDNLNAGLRLVKVPRYNADGSPTGTYRIMLVKSDLDIGVVARRVDNGFVNVPDSQFISMRWDPRLEINLPDSSGILAGKTGNFINAFNGSDIVMHGSLHNGMIDPNVPIGIRTPGFREYFFDEPWFFFDQDGYFGTYYAHEWIPHNLPDVWQGILNSGGGS
jgi:hypothetical protein